MEEAFRAILFHTRGLSISAFPKRTWRAYICRTGKTREEQ